jgi:hypothetical protein
MALIMTCRPYGVKTMPWLTARPPAARCYGVGKIERDQVEDYARRS